MLPFLRRVYLCIVCNMQRIFFASSSSLHFGMSLCNNTHIACCRVKCMESLGQLIVNTLLAAWSNTTAHTLFIEFKNLREADRERERKLRCCVVFFMRDECSSAKLECLFCVGLTKVMVEC